MTVPSSTAATRHDFDVLVIGSGAAGLATALGLADGARVAVLSKDAIDAGSTNWAQGGIAAVLDEADDTDAHVADTIAAGAGLCHEDTVRYVVEAGPGAVGWLVDQGVAFDRDADADDARFHHATSAELDDLGRALFVCGYSGRVTAIWRSR